MMCNETFSRKITVLSIVAMFGVILIHSTTIFTAPHPAQWNVFVQHFLTRSLTRWAVPFFFLMSGFWFGRKGFSVRKKFRGLVVPYLMWAILGVLIAFPLTAGNNFLTHRGLIERTWFEIPGAWNKFNALFGITLMGPKGDAPLWYVRCLIVMFLFAPIWKMLASRRLGLLLLFVFGVCQTGVFPFEIPYLNVLTFAWGWFALGIVLSKSDVEDLKIANGWFYAAGVIWLIMSIVNGLRIAQYVAVGGYLSSRCEMFIAYSGIIFMWGLYDRLRMVQEVALPWALRQTFFIYCLHEIICGYFMASGLYVFGKGDTATLVLMVVVPFAALFTCMGVAVVLNRVVPRFYQLLTGGRGK